ncbi:MAG: AAA family ATPase, partial [Bacteroidia bacterium]
MTFNEGWNDYSYRTIFYLFFYDADKVRNYVGQTKIIRNDAEFTTIIPNEFTKLEDDFCSMGQTISYYQDLKALLGHNLESVLFALRDVAFFPKILESFERLEKYKLSIIRSDRVERLVR